jgi:hypothetical protein
MEKGRRPLSVAVIFVILIGVEEKLRIVLSPLFRFVLF